MKCTVVPLRRAPEPVDGNADVPLLSELIDTFSVVAFRADLGDRLTYLSPAWTSVTGRLVRDSLGQTLTSLLMEEDRPAAVARLAPLLVGTAARSRHEARCLVGGSPRWLSIRTAVSRDGFGRVVGLCGFIADATEWVGNARRVAESEERYRLLADYSNDMIVRLGLDGVRRYVSPACRVLLGYEPEELVGQTPAGAIHADDRARTVEICTSLLSGAVDPMCVYRQARKDGSWAWLEATYRLIRDQLTGEPQEFIASVRDVSRREAAELAAREAAARAHEGARLLAMAESVAKVGHWRLDVGDGSVFWSPEVYRIYGLGPGHVPNLEGGLSAYHPADRASVRTAVERSSKDGSGFEFSARIVRPGGEIRHISSSGQAERGPDGSILGLFGVVRDTTDQIMIEQALRDGERRYRRLAETDELTGLANRRRFIAELEAACVGAEATSLPLSVAIFDIDHFKRVNDTYGHPVGDAVLKDVANATRRALRESDLVGRLGGEEFAVLMRGANLAIASQIAESLRLEVEASLPRQIAPELVTISVGVSQYRLGLDGSQLLAAADEALYEAKSTGRNRVCVART